MKQNIYRCFNYVYFIFILDNFCYSKLCLKVSFIIFMDQTLDNVQIKWYFEGSFFLYFQKNFKAHGQTAENLKKAEHFAINKVH